MNRQERAARWAEAVVAGERGFAAATTAAGKLADEVRKATSAIRELAEALKTTGDDDEPTGTQAVGNERGTRWRH